MGSFVLDEGRTEQILQLALENKMLRQHSSDEDMPFEREPFSTEYFIYSGSMYNNQDEYPSVISTACIHESTKPQRQPGRRALRLLSKIMQMLRFRWGNQWTQTTLSELCHKHILIVDTLSADIAIGEVSTLN